MSRKVKVTEILTNLMLGSFVCEKLNAAHPKSYLTEKTKQVSIIELQS